MQNATSNLFDTNQMNGTGIYEAIAVARKNPRISDIDLNVGEAPVCRLDGDIIPAAVSSNIVTTTAVNEFLELAAVNAAVERQQMNDDGSYTIVHRSAAYPQIGRVRITAYRTMGKDALAMRLLEDVPPELEGLDLPPVFAHIAENTRGIALIGGPTGVGKTTAMAAIINRANTDRAKKILILEEFPEYVHVSKKAAIRAIQVGRGFDAPSYKKALDTSLRNDADIVVVAEARTPAAIMAALVAADLGKRVIMGVHIDSVTRFADRIIGAFPADQQNMVRTLLAAHVHEVTYTVLPKRIKPTERYGRIPACEILTRRDGLVEAIAENGEAVTTEAALSNYIDNGLQQGDMKLESYLAKLVGEKVITPEAAMDAALRKTELKRKLDKQTDTSPKRTFV
jgi:twitching motility protein PilT